jgi:hypothetical protein
VRLEVKIPVVVLEAGPQEVLNLGVGAYKALILEPVQKLGCQRPDRAFGSVVGFVPVAISRWYSFSAAA